jgi:hypothetical protein
MKPVRRAALAGGLLLVTITGCDDSTGPRVTVARSEFSNTTMPRATAPAATPTATATASYTQPASTVPSSEPPVVTSAPVVHPPPSTVSIPSHLCDGMDAAQNAADAYLGSLSAGNLAEAMACVQPDTVPEAVSRSLLAKAGSSAAYLPRDGVDGPSVFGYRGGGKLIDVTVARQPGGQFRVTKVVIRSGG